MKRKKTIAFTIAVLAALFVSVVEAQETPPPDKGITSSAEVEDSSSSGGVDDRQAGAGPAAEKSDTNESGHAPANKSAIEENSGENKGNRREQIKFSNGHSFDGSNDFKKKEGAQLNQIERILAAVDSEAEVSKRILAAVESKTDEGAQPNGIWFTLPLWIAAVISLLILVVVLVFLFSPKYGIRRLVNKIENDHQQLQNKIADLNSNIKVIRGVLGESSLEKQFNKVEKALQSFESKIGKVNQTAQDCRDKFDEGKNSIKDLKERIMNGLFGREKTQTPESGFARQINEKLEAFRVDILNRLETSEKLQSQKRELDNREYQLKKREQDFDNECEKARKDGASAAEREAESHKKAYDNLAKILSEQRAEFEKTIEEQSIEFGKRTASLEMERNNAMADAQKAQEESAKANIQMENAIKERTQYKGEVSRLSSEIAKRDQDIAKREESWNTERVKIRDEIRNEIEQSYAETLAEHRARLENAHKERDNAMMSVEKMREAKAIIDAKLDETKKSLETEKLARENDHAAAEQELEAEKQARKLERENAEQNLAIVSGERDKAKCRLFPEEFRDDPSFEPLLAELDALDVAGAPGSTLARASLAIFADRKNLSAKIWQRALGDLSLGLALAMDSKEMQPADIVSTLGAWKSAIEKHMTGGPSFSLNLPSVGSKVDISWMHAKSGAASVSRVLSWAVYGQSGLAYMAEVE